ncbi:hypothetical protein [Microcystis aeruginosa]|nr:hypothetical protein [Microcystis aeruginosa]
MNSRKEKERNEQARRLTLYMSEELYNQVINQSKENETTKSRLIVDLLNLFLMSPVGQKLQENAKKNRRSLHQELESNLVLFNEQIPTEEISRLAETSQRNPDQMLIHLVLLGLQVYREKEELGEKGSE